jgi:hypothetical protein
MTPAIAMDARPGGPTTKRQPSPEGLGTRSCLRQVGKDMNEVREAIITAITPNGSATLPFVIPSEAEGSAVQSFVCNEFVIPTGAYPDFLPRGARRSSVCAFP